MAKKKKYYKLPESYLRKQRFTIFLLENRWANCDLVCWYIGPETGNLVGIYCPKRENSPIFYKSFILSKKWYQWHHEFYCGGETEAEKVYNRIRNSPEVYLTDYMPYFMQMTNNPPPKPEGKIIEFPGIKKTANCNQKKNNAAKRGICETYRLRGTVKLFVCCRQKIKD